MEIIKTEINDLRPKCFLVTIHMSEASTLDASVESIAITLEIETVDDNPYLAEVRGVTLSRALEIIQREIQAQKAAGSQSA
jgi:hypothetical protein